MRASILSAIIILAVAVPAAAQTIAITNGTVYPVSGPPIQNGTVLIRDGVIIAVGARVTVPADALKIDATGKVVTPGLINAAAELGVIEVDQVKDTKDDTAKGTNNIAAAFRVWEGLNPASQMFAPTRNEGITTAVITPQGGLVAGQAAVIDLVSGHASDMIRKAPVAMVTQVDSPNGAGTGARGELLSKLRALLDDVKAYEFNRADYERAAIRTLNASKPDLEALIPVVDGKMPLIVEANRMDEIDAALALARDYHLKIIISRSLAQRRPAGSGTGARTDRGDEQHTLEFCDAESAAGECGAAAPRRCPGGAGRHRGQRRVAVQRA